MMYGSWKRSWKVGAVTIVAACATLVGVRMASGRIAGGSGTKPDCYSEFDGITATRTSNPPRVDCEDGDPSCDTDGKCDGTCTFKIRLCVNQTDVSGCTPPAGGIGTIKVLPNKTPYTNMLNGLDKTTASCSSAFTDIPVKVRGGKKPKPGKLQLRVLAKAQPHVKPPLDKDLVLLVCKPRPSSETCPIQPSTTTTTSTIVGQTTTTTAPGLCTPGACTCPGGAPSKLSFTTGLSTGTCGNLQNDSGQNFFSIKCGGLYFGGDSVAVPLPSVIPDQGTSLVKTCCNGNTLTLSGTTGAEAGGNRCVGGTGHGNACTANADCPGGTCALLKCTDQGCLFGPPLPIPNGSHGGASTSTCVVNTVSANAAGTADCSTGQTSSLAMPLTSTLYLTGDLLTSRCTGGTAAGKGCSSNTDCTGGGTCTNDTGRCTNDGTPCVLDANCTGGTCETGSCAGGANVGKGCVADTDCPASTCQTLIQPCPICNATTHLCNGGPNDGLACTPGDSGVNGDYPTSHDCPPPPDKLLGSLPIAFDLSSGTVTKTATDTGTMTDVFCGFCSNNAGTSFKNPPVTCATNNDCASVTGFTKCRQAHQGAFSGDDIARTITVTGSPATGASTGGAAVPSTLVTIFCIPPTFNQLVDSAADLGGPGATTLIGTTQLLP